MMKLEDYVITPINSAMILSLLLPTVNMPKYGHRHLGKYPEGNWEKGMPWTEVIASAMRHLEAIRLGEDIDAESGLLHAAHLQCNAAMLTEYYFTKQDFDNRKKYEK
jgi:hypothetical protein